MLGGLTSQWKLLQKCPVLTVVMALRKQRPFFRSALPAMSAISQRRSPVDFSHQVLGKTEFARQEMSFDVASVMFHLHRSKPCWKVIEFHGIPTFCNKRQQLGLHLLRGCNPQHPRCYVGPNWISKAVKTWTSSTSSTSRRDRFPPQLLTRLPSFRLLSETQTSTDLMSRGNNHCTKIATCCAWLPLTCCHCPWSLMSRFFMFFSCLDGSSFGAVFFPWSIWKVLPNELLQITGCQICS